LVARKHKHPNTTASPKQHGGQALWKSGNACNKEKESKPYPENSFTTPRNGADFQPNIIIVHILSIHVKQVSKSSYHVHNVAIRVFPGIRQ